VDNFYLIVSRLNSYKRIELAVEAFNLLGLPLKIIGTGPFLRTLKSMARPNVTFLGRLTDLEVADYYVACKALIFPGVEDFGIAPLEANAAGRPVIAFKGGGAVDTIAEGINGLFFHENTAESLISAIRSFEMGEYDFQPGLIHDYVLRFDKEIFKQKMWNFILDKYRASSNHPISKDRIQLHQQAGHLSKRALKREIRICWRSSRYCLF